MKASNEKYLESKLRQIEGEIAIAVGVANMIGVIEHRCNDTVIKSRDRATDNVHKMVHQIIKRLRN